MQEQNRDFKGVWIPKEIWLNNELTLLEKCIFTEINSLDNENHCIASNEYFANFCQCSESKISKIIKKLCDLNMIKILAFDGRHRQIRVVQRTMQSSSKNYAASLKEQTINIDNNTVRKSFLSKDKNDRAKTVTEAHVEKFLRLYEKHCSNLPKVRGITDKRKQAIKKICGKYSFEDIITAFDMANESAFLTGNNDRGWKANIDFILREDKFVSILEGKYGGKKQTKRTFIESGAEHVQSFDEEDQKKLQEFQEQLKKDGKQIFF